MRSFMKGFNALIPQNLLQIFDENEVEVCRNILLVVLPVLTTLIMLRRL